MFSLISRLRNRDTNEQGFSMVELLVVMLIMGILAAIAIPMYLNQKKTAIDTTVASDVTSAGNEIESILASYPGGSCIQLGAKNTSAKPYYPLQVFPTVTSGACSGTSLGTSNIYISDKNTVLSIPSGYNDVYGTNGYGIKGTNSKGNKSSTTTGYVFYANKGGLQ